MRAKDFLSFSTTNSGDGKSGTKPHHFSDQKKAIPSSALGKGLFKGVRNHSLPGDIPNSRCELAWKLKNLGIKESQSSQQHFFVSWKILLVVEEEVESWKSEIHQQGGQNVWETRASTMLLVAVFSVGSYYLEIGILCDMKWWAVCCMSRCVLYLRLNGVSWYPHHPWNASRVIEKPD